jgi:hypothetical protein
VTAKPKSTEQSEEELFEDSLRAHGQLVEDDSDDQPPNATHHVEINERGERFVRRDRFSAI